MIEDSLDDGIAVTSSFNRRGSLLAVGCAFAPYPWLAWLLPLEPLRCCTHLASCHLPWPFHPAAASSGGAQRCSKVDPRGNVCPACRAVLACLTRGCSTFRCRTQATMVAS